MEDRQIDAMGEAAQAGAQRAMRTAHDMASRAQEAASHAGSSMQTRMGRVSERAQDFAQDMAQTANQRLERVTGHSLQSWRSEARRFVQDHPLQAIALAVGLGFMLGKLLQRD